MHRRILALARATLAGEWFHERGGLPVAPLLLHGSLAAAICAVARGDLPPYAYALLALALPLALTAVPLLGELGPLLRADPAAEWVGALPVRPIELRAARVLCIAVLLGSLALASLVPAALLAPAGSTVGLRAGIVALGLVETLVMAAALLALQALLGGRAEGGLVLVQTALFAGVVVGAVLGLRWLPELARLEAPLERATLFPPVWFAAWLFPGRAPGAWLALASALGAALVFAAAPFPPATPGRHARSPLSVLLRPARALATRVWVRPEERAPFDLVYDALPAERDFVIRTYPLVAIPLAFLLLGADARDPRGEGLLAILVFAPVTYLPVLLAHVPATATPAARWLVDTSPLAPAVERGGALKAVAVRFLLPLYVALAIVAGAIGGPTLALRLALPSAALALLCLRRLWDRCVGAPPLSRPVSDLGTAWNDEWTGMLFVVAGVSTAAAIATWRLVASPWTGLAIAALAVAAELLLRRRAGDALVR